MKLSTIILIALFSVTAVFAVTDPFDDFDMLYERAVKEIPERIANEKAGYGRVTNVERKRIEEEERNANGKAGYGRVTNVERAEIQRIAEITKNAKYERILDAYFVQIPGRNCFVMQTEITQKQWQTIMGSNPSKYNGDNNPVENVSWIDCVMFCNELSKKVGLEPCYSYKKTTDTKKWKLKQKELKKWSKEWKKFNQEMICNFEASGYRLPTDEEWKFAASGGETYVYAGSNNIFNVAWYELNSVRKTHSVAQKSPNGYGLYDMSGNVWEWVWDVNPCNDNSRCLRGGSWRDGADLCEVDCGNNNYAGGQYDYLGFRTVK